MTNDEDGLTPEERAAFCREWIEAKFDLSRRKKMNNFRRDALRDIRALISRVIDDIEFFPIEDYPETKQELAEAISDLKNAYQHITSALCY